MQWKAALENQCREGQHVFQMLILFCSWVFYSTGNQTKTSPLRTAMSLKHILQQGTLPGGWRVHGCPPDHPATLSWSSWAPRGERYRQHGAKTVRYYSSLKYIPSLGTASHRFSWMPQDWSGIVALSPCSVTPLPRIWDTDMQEDTTKPPVLSPGKTKPWVFHVAWYICSLSPW